MRDFSEGKIIGFETVLCDERFKDFIHTKGRTEIVMVELKRADKRGRCLTRACELQTRASFSRSSLLTH